MVQDAGEHLRKIGFASDMGQNTRGPGGLAMSGNTRTVGPASRANFLKALNNGGNAEDAVSVETAGAPPETVSHAQPEEIYVYRSGIQVTQELLEDAPLTGRQMKRELRASNRQRKSPKRSAAALEEAGDEERTYDWPTITIGRPVDVRASKPGWAAYARDVSKRNESKAWKIGQLIPLDTMVCQYFSTNELDSVMAEIYPGVDQNPDDAHREMIARKFVARAKLAIDEVGSAHDDALFASYLSVNTDKLRRRMADPDNPDWYKDPLLSHDDQLRMAERSLTYEALDPEDFATQLLLEKQDRLWQPSAFEIGDPDGCGPKLFGFNIVDEQSVLRQERDALVKKFGATFHFDPELLCSEEGWSPKIAFIHMDSGSVDRFERQIPGSPLQLPLRRPTAYIS